MDEHVAVDGSERIGALLPAAFYSRDAVTVARGLLGMILVREEVALRITETEAYVSPEDTACHARFGRTPRTAPMWGPGGHTYVYLCYGVHWLLNVVSGEAGHPAAVLIRACEPVRGLATVRARRGGKQGPAMLDGPGKVGAALGLDGGWTDHPLFEPGGLEIRQGWAPARILAGPRVGIDYAEPADRDTPWRFAEAGSRWVGHRKRLTIEVEPRVQRRAVLGDHQEVGLDVGTIL